MPVFLGFAQHPNQALGIYLVSNIAHYKYLEY